MSARPNIVLTGFMGTGKSTAGRILAHRLRYNFIDTDVLIEERHGSIAELFDQLGEPGFRELECAIVEELSTTNRTVISTGGGMMLDESNVAKLTHGAIVFCLVAGIDEIMKRVSTGRQKRPLVDDADNPRQRVEQLLAERAPAYARFTQVNTDGMSASAVASLLAVKAATAVQMARTDHGSSKD
jgi:shikimate kinase